MLCKGGMRFGIKSNKFKGTLLSVHVTDTHYRPTLWSERHHTEPHALLQCEDARLRALSAEISSVILVAA